MGPGSLARALIGAAVLVGCAGPDPAIERVAIVAPRLAGRVRVELVVVNRSGGHGQVEVEIRLRPRDAVPGTVPAIVPGIVIDRPVELDAHERAELTVDVPAPDGDYTADARVQYPD